VKTPVSFYSEGCRLVGDVYYPQDLRPGDKRAGVVLCHGYTGVKDLYLPDNARVLTEAGYVAMTFDYKGWGDSEGPRSRLAPYLIHKRPEPTLARGSPAVIACVVARLVRQARWPAVRAGAAT